MFSWRVHLDRSTDFLNTKNWGRKNERNSNKKKLASLRGREERRG
jgi:hypothetical protein